jgi:ADP-ribose pyrophosphatase YjhB (NUDIX family)
MGEGMFEGEWTVPGGQLNWGEHPEDAVRREMLEETGLTAEVGPLLGVFSHAFLRSEERPWDSVHVLGLFYAITRLEGTLRPEPGTGHHVEWIPLADLRHRQLSAILEGALPLLEAAGFETADRSLLPE